MEQSTGMNGPALETVSLPGADQQQHNQVPDDKLEETTDAQGDDLAQEREDHIRQEDSMSARMQRLWQQARDSGDFQNWISLLKVAEQLDDREKVREAYDGFLAEYPLCFGYWKKYAEAEVRHGIPEQALVVYERGVAAVPYSVDMWAHYCNYRINGGASQEEVEGLFERAAAYVGADYHAHGLWDKYLRYEHAISNTQLMAQLYTRILSLPIRDLDRYHSEFVAYARDHTANELASPEEASEIRDELEAALRAALEAAAAAKRRAARHPPAQVSTVEQRDAAVTSAAAENISITSHVGVAAMETDASPNVVPGTAMAVEAASGRDEQLEHPAAEDAAMDDVLDAQPHNHDPRQLEVELDKERDVIANTAAANGSDIAGMDEANLARHLVAAAVRQAVAADGSAAGSGNVAAQVEDMQDAGPITIPDIADADIKRQWLARREAIFKAAKIELAKRHAFEKTIRRPYFHIKPLDPAQLTAWSKYLDFSESHSDDAATVRLYERCLVACAQYPEFWVRYICYLDGKGEAERAQDAFLRATNLFCKRSPHLFLFAARRHELQQSAEGMSHIQAAREAYDKVALQLAPGMVQCTVQRANFERRQGDVQAACRVFEDHIAAVGSQLIGNLGETNAEEHHDRPNHGDGTAAVESSSSSASVFAFLNIQYAHFLQTVMNDAVRARRVYQEALVDAPHIKSLWEGAMHLETVERAAGYVDRVLELYDKATAPPPPPPAPKEAVVADQQHGGDLQAAAQKASASGEAAKVEEDRRASNAAGGERLETPAKELAVQQAYGTQLKEEAGTILVNKGLSTKEREELSERMVAFADLHGSATDLQRAEQLHFQRFKLPLAFADRKRGLDGVAGGQPGSKKAAVAVQDSLGGDLVGSQETANAAATNTMGYYGSAGYSAYNYGAYYGGYAGYGYY